jgi:hypothetical protein
MLRLTGELRGLRTELRALLTLLAGDLDYQDFKRLPRDDEAVVLRTQQAYAVMLVIRTSDGEIRWMDVSACLKRESTGGKAVRQIVFAGERFDAVSVQNWRKKTLAGG